MYLFLIALYLHVGFILTSSGDLMVRSDKTSDDPTIEMLKDMAENNPTQYKISFFLGILLWYPVLIYNWIVGK